MITHLQLLCGFIGLGLWSGGLAAQTPQQLLQRGHYQQALQLAAERLQRSRSPRPDDLIVLTQAYNLAQAADTAAIGLLHRQATDHSSWLQLAPAYARIRARQHLAAPYLTPPGEPGYSPPLLTLPADSLYADAAARAYAHCLAQVNADLPAARIGDKPAARRAYAWTEKMPAFALAAADTVHLTLGPELFDLATVRVWLNLQPLAEHTAAYGLDNPLPSRPEKVWRRDWLEVHFLCPDARIDFELTAYPRQVHVSGDQLSSSSVTNCVDVLDRVETVTETVTDGDTTYCVQRTVEHWINVCGTVTEVVQEKTASLSADLWLYPYNLPEPIGKWVGSGSSWWRHSYTLCEGDSRAISTVCTGMQAWYPSERSMLTDAINDLRSQAQRHLREVFDE